MKSVFRLSLLAAMWLAQVVVAANPDTEYYPVPNDPTLPFSEAVRVGNMLYLAGQLGLDATTGKLVEGGISAETRQTMENIKATLERHGSALGNVVKCTVFLADIAEWAEMNKVYLSYFPERPPARSALGANGLALGARTEIECIATVQ